MKTVIGFVLALVAMFAHADVELNKLLEGKVAEYKGVCLIDLKGNVVLSKENSIGAAKCIVGAAPTDGPNKFILLWSGDFVSRLVQFNIVTNAQRVVWRKPNGDL